METMKIRLDMSTLVELLSESIKHNFLYEKRSVKSKTLADLLNQAGETSHSHKYKSVYSDVDLNTTTDDDILSVEHYNSYKATCDELKRKFKNERVGFINFASLNIIVAVKMTQENTAHEDKIDARWRESNKLDGKDRYRWNDTEAQELVFKNPWFREWDKESQEKTLSDIRTRRENRKQGK